MKKFYWQVYAVFIAVTLAIGGLSGLITRKGMEEFDSVAKSSLTPPNIVFPIVWSILFILMGIGSARVFLAKEPNKGGALIIYAVQLLVNFFWSPIYFNLRAFGFSFFWIILLWFLIIAMIVLFWRVDKPAALLQIPYLLWVTFAAYLNFTTWMLNR